MGNNQQHKPEQNMQEFELALYDKGLIFVAGVDEAGRGPLAGPVVAAAVVFSKGFVTSGLGSNLGIKDSKKLTAKKREELYQVIKSEALAYGIGLVDHEEIDKINILQATKKAMRLAVDQANLLLAEKAAEAEAAEIGVKGLPAENAAIDHVLIDAVKIEGLELAQTPIIKGDDLSISIAAASILAKVYRDKLMEDYAEEYPGYGFEKHKGYGTKAHYEAINLLGLCPIHRKSFLSKYV